MDRIRPHHIVYIGEILEKSMRMPLSELPENGLLAIAQMQDISITITQRLTDAYQSALEDEDLFGDVTYAVDFYGPSVESKRYVETNLYAAYLKYISMNSKDPIEISVKKDNICDTCYFQNHCKNILGDLKPLIKVIDWIRIYDLISTTNEYVVTGDTSFAFSLIANIREKLSFDEVDPTNIDWENISIKTTFGVAIGPYVNHLFNSVYSPQSVEDEWRHIVKQTGNNDFYLLSEKLKMVVFTY